MAVEYKEFDKNVIVNATIRNVDVELFDIRQEPFDIYGLFEPNDPQKERFERIPREVALSVSEGVGVQSYEPAGGKVRFCTDSDYVAIKVETAWMTRRPHFTFIEAAGFDMYVDVDGRELLQGVFVPPHDAEGGYEQILRFPDRKRRYLTINFPLHACVKKLQVGLRPGSFLGHGKKYINEKPVVCYGSSITQGTGASRPGTAYCNLLAQRLNVHFYNLGFSGQCRGEPRCNRAPGSPAGAMLTMPLEKTLTFRSPTLTVASLTPLLLIVWAISRLMMSPGMTRISPVMGSAMGSAAS